MKPDGWFRVERVICAVDCGVAVNPGVIRKQMEGGIGYGLAAALDGAITLKNGRVKQSNFHDYRVLRMNDAESGSAHRAFAGNTDRRRRARCSSDCSRSCNALFALTGKRIRTLPIRSSTERMTPGRARPCYRNASSSAFASTRSAVAKPSVNRP